MGDDVEGMDAVLDATGHVARLRRIEGQVRGLQRMVLDRRPCLDVTTQIDAVTGALRRVRADLVRAGMEDVIATVLPGDDAEGERRGLSDALGALFSKVV